MKKARAHHRPDRMYRGSLQHEPDRERPRRARLKMKRGATEIHPATADGEWLGPVKNPTAQLYANIGDRLMIMGRELDDIATADVVSVYPDGTMLVAIAAPRGTYRTPADGGVIVMKAGKAG